MSGEIRHSLADILERDEPGPFDDSWEHWGPEHQAHSAVWWRRYEAERAMDLYEQPAALQLVYTGSDGTGGTVEMDADDLGKFIAFLQAQRDRITP